MALQGTIKLRDSFGADTPLECYARVATVSGTKSTQYADVEFFALAAWQGYLEEKARVEAERLANADAAQPVGDIDPSAPTPIANRGYVFAPDLGGGNFIEQAYEHIKTLPEFAEMITVPAEITTP